MKTIGIFCLMLALVGMMLSTASVQAQNEKVVPEMKGTGHKVIRLNYTFGVNPATATVKKGTTVIWINESSSIVELQFEGKQVTMACGSPVGFFVNEEGSYTSQKIIPKAVVSLCFIEPGEFPYQLLLGKLKGPDPLQGKNFKGTIIVE